MHSSQLTPSTSSLLNPPSSPLFLNHKHKRTPYSFVSPSNKGNICSICLEYDKYSISPCVQCTKCKSYCHMTCYEREFIPPYQKNFICNACEQNISSRKCFLCSESNGIVVQLKQTNQWCHLYCKRFYTEIVDYEKNISQRKCNSSINNISLRKWRYKNKCKLCHLKYNDIPVIKCCNCKCKNYYHISCAVRNGLIFNMSFQDDFYGFNRMNRDAHIAYPFYCNYHNKNLIHEYEDYVSQMDAVLVNPSKEEVNVKNEIEDNNENDYNSKEHYVDNNIIQIQTHMEVTVPAKTVQKEYKVSNNVNNKENKVKVYFDSDNKNTQFGYNEIGNCNDEFDCFKNFEQMLYGFGHNDQKVMHCGFGLDFFS